MSEQRRLLGRTGVELSALGMGCAPIGGLHGPVDAQDARDAIDAAWNNGVRYFDTSPWYGLGLSELRLGERLRDRPRENFIVSTKVGRTLHRPVDPAYRDAFWRGGLPFDHRFDYSYDGIMRSYEDSLARLGINRVDLLLIHDLDIAELGSAERVAHHFADLDRSGWRALESLRRYGEIRGIGAGVNLMGTIPVTLARYDIDFFLVAMPYTLIDQAPLDAEFPLCAARGAGLVIGSPFASGILATGADVAQPLYNYAHAPPDIVMKVRRIETVCASHGVPLKAAALQFPLRHPLVASVVPGAIDASQAGETFALDAVTIPEALWTDLRTEGLIHADAP
jgi:D-threo-aldose 1-dehydrogenase